MLDTVKTRPETIDMKLRQMPLREFYARLPSAAQISDHATTRSDRVKPSDPLYAEVELGDVNQTRVSLALHEGVGGKSDLPVPGELFSAAIASCMDSTIRVITNMLGIELETLEIHAEAKVDLRGTLRMDASVPVAFQDIDVTVQMVPVSDVPKEHLDAIMAAAEQSCVVLQTLRAAPQISVSRR